MSSFHPGSIASRRGGAIEPLPIGNANAGRNTGNPVSTPRTSRSHLLAGLRTAPKTPTGGFPTSLTVNQVPQTQDPAQGPFTHYNMSAVPKTAPIYPLALPSLDGQQIKQMDPATVSRYMFLAQQHNILQQQLRLLEVQAAMYGHGQTQPSLYPYVDPTTGKVSYLVDQGQIALEQEHAAQQQQQLQQLQLQQQLQQLQMIQQLQQKQQQQSAPRVQVSPPTEHTNTFRSSSPPNHASATQVEAAPSVSVPSGFRRGHKKNSSLSLATQELAKNTTPRTMPSTLTGTQGPGQGRAGEHPIRQPRGPPSFDELKAKPTARHEGSKNFAAFTRRSVVHSLVRAGYERRNVPSSVGSMSPVSESAEEFETPVTDPDSHSVCSGSGSLAGDIDCSPPNARSSPGSFWGAIGAERPGSRQKGRSSMDGLGSEESSPGVVDNTFAGVFKNAARRSEPSQQTSHKAPMLVLTNAEKRKDSPVLAA